MSQFDATTTCPANLNLPEVLPLLRHDDGARCWARFASLIGTCRINGVEPYAYLLDLYTKLANGHLKKDIAALMPWAYGAATSPKVSSSGTP